jgi:hypothetical protein
VSQLAIPGTDVAEQPEGTLIWPPEPPDEAEPYTTPIDRAAYARQALTDAYRRGRGPRNMRAAGALLSEHGDSARLMGRNHNAGAEVDRLLTEAGVPYAPQMELL